MKTLTRRLAGTTLALLLALAPAQVDAQEAPDREELVTFTEAYVEIGEVRAEVSPQLAEAETQEEASAIQQEANDRMTEILQEKGMTVDRYSDITSLLNSDQELRSEFEAIYEEISGV